MRNFDEQARTALRTYLERGETILNNIEQGRIKSLENLLRLRTAAFHNFKVADFELQRQGIDIARETDVQQLWSRIKEVDFRLHDVLVEVRNGFQGEILRNRRARTNIGKYRSGMQHRSMFVQSI